MFSFIWTIDLKRPESDLQFLFLESFHLYVTLISCMTLGKLINFFKSVCTNLKHGTVIESIT